MAIRTATTSAARQELPLATTDNFVFQPAPRPSGNVEAVALEHEPAHASEPTLQHEKTHTSTLEALLECLYAWECNVPDGFYGP